MGFEGFSGGRGLGQHFFDVLKSTPRSVGPAVTGAGGFVEQRVFNSRHIPELTRGDSAVHGTKLHQINMWGTSVHKSCQHTHLCVILSHARTK